MHFQVGEGLTALSYPSQDQALDAAIMAPVLRSLVHDDVSVSPCFLRVRDGLDMHHFAAFVVSQLDGAGRTVSQGLLLALNEADRISERFVWIPPKLVDGEQFAVESFTRGKVENLLS